MNIATASQWIKDLNSMTAQIKNAAQQAKEEIQNSTAPINERWNAWVMISPYLPTASYYSNAFSAFGRNFNLYDDLYLERHEVRSWADIDEMLNDELFQEENKSWLTEGSLNAFKEAVIKEGYGGFKYDW